MRSNLAIILNGCFTEMMDTPELTEQTPLTFSQDWNMEEENNAMIFKQIITPENGVKLALKEIESYLFIKVVGQSSVTVDVPFHCTTTVPKNGMLLIPLRVLSATTMSLSNNGKEKVRVEVCQVPCPITVAE